MCSTRSIQTSLWMGCPIRIHKAHRLDAAPLICFAGLRVLHRQTAPRHPPRTLCSLLFSHSFSWTLPREGDYDWFSAWFSVFSSHLVQQDALSKIEGISVQLEKYTRCRDTHRARCDPNRWRVETRQTTAILA